MPRRDDAGVLVDVELGRGGALVPVGGRDTLAGVGVEAAVVGDEAVPDAAVGEQVAGRVGQRPAHHVGGAAGGGAGVVGDAVGVRGAHDDLVDVALEVLGGEAGQHLDGALAHVGGGGLHLVAAVRAGARCGPRPCWGSASP